MTRSLCVWLLGLYPTTPVDFWGGFSVCRRTGHRALDAQVKGQLEHPQLQEVESPMALGGGLKNLPRGGESCGLSMCVCL